MEITWNTEKERDNWTVSMLILVLHGGGDTIYRGLGDLLAAEMSCLREIEGNWLVH